MYFCNNSRSLRTDFSNFLQENTLRKFITKQADIEFCTATIFIYSYSAVYKTSMSWLTFTVMQSDIKVKQVSSQPKCDRLR